MSTRFGSDRFTWPSGSSPRGATRRRLLQGAAAAGLLGTLQAGGLGADGVLAQEGGNPGKKPSVPDLDPRLDWFLDAKIGMFVHWGPYAVAGVEASWPIMVPGLTGLLGPDQMIEESEYLDLAKHFDPGSFRPREWIAFARRAGMRYLVVTAKHHDGFALFDAPGTTFKSTAGPSGRDLMKELAEACEAESFPLGFYFSPPDMQDPGYRDTSRSTRENWTGEPERAAWSEFLDRMEAQIESLLTDYGPIRVLWFDGLFEHDRYQPERMLATVRRLQPTCLVNDRLGHEHADYVTPEQAVPDGVLVRRADSGPEVTAAQFRAILDMIASGTDPAAFQRLLEQSMRVRFPSEPFPAPERFQPWEACMTVGATWSYDPLHRALKSPTELLRVVLDVVSRGGNLLLNLGPGPDGRLPEPECQRVAVLGEWLRRNEQAIYGTTYGRFPELSEVRSTRPRHQPQETRRDYFVPLGANGNSVGLRPGVDGRPIQRPTRAFRLEDGAELRLVRQGADLKLEPPTNDSPSAGHVLPQPVYVMETQKERAQP